MRPFHHSLSHLARAEVLMSDAKPESILYAALELRYAVESRLLEYAERAKEIGGKISKNPKRGSVAEDVDRAFGVKGVEYRVTIHSKRLEKPLTLSYYPISRKLLKIVGMTDNYLHSAGLIAAWKSDWRRKLTELVKTGIAEAKLSASSGLTGPLIFGDGNATSMFQADPLTHPELELLMHQGENIDLQIEVIRLAE